MDEVTISDILEHQRQLEIAARKKFPYDPSECTLYMDIPPRQLLFTCLTCKPSNAICYACGLQCHTNHDIVELYSKREFRCDCGTSRNPGVTCNLRRTDNDDWPNSHLQYKQNFHGRFCKCSESVKDLSYGEGAMFQCLLGTRCGEDWFHARCIAGITRDEEVARQQSNETLSVDSDVSGDVLDTIYPELPADFGALICPECSADVPLIIESPVVLASVNGYIFLQENYGDIIKQSPQLSKLLHEFPFFSGDEPSYLPAEDTDEMSLLEAGEKALQGLPHQAVVEGLAKFNDMQNTLIEYLRKIASNGRTVTREDIEQFFRNQRSQ